MAKYLVESYYTCSFKVKHYIDNLSEKELENLDQREDGKFEVLDVKLDNRKTKNLKENGGSKAEMISQPIISKDNKNAQKSKKIDDNFKKNISEKIGKRFGMPDRRKGYIQK